MLSSSLLMLSLYGCEMVQGFLEPEPDVASAEAALQRGDLPAADAAYMEAVTAAPGNIDAATGAAHLALLQGDYARADQHLVSAIAAAEAAGEPLDPKLILRRALVALEAGEDLAKVRQFGEQSNMPVGLLLAAEVALADGEPEEAAELLGRISDNGAVGEAAEQYLALINDPEPLVAGLSEAAALWSLGEEKVAVRSVEDLFKVLPEDQTGRDEMLLMWSSRAASVGETEIARSLHDSVLFPPEGQAWRKTATLAIIYCAEGKGEECLETFALLEGAPSDGLDDAKATAAMLIARLDRDVAQELVGSVQTNAAARALLEAGNASAARDMAEGPMKIYLESGG
jgi:tetratricopeptide (TPR) repeat protein